MQLRGGGAGEEVKQGLGLGKWDRKPAAAMTDHEVLSLPTPVQMTKWQSLLTCPRLLLYLLSEPRPEFAGTDISHPRGCALEPPHTEEHPHLCRSHRADRSSGEYREGFALKLFIGAMKRTKASPN